MTMIVNTTQGKCANRAGDLICLGIPFEIRIDGPYAYQIWVEDSISVKATQALAKYSSENYA